MVKILQVAIGGKTFTGVANYLYQQYLHMNRSRIHYDFLFCRENSMELVNNNEIFSDSKFMALNAFDKRTKSTDYIALVRGVRKALKEGNYDYIVVNTSVIEVVYACLVASRGFCNLHFIAHAHNTGLVLKQKSIRNRLSSIIRFSEYFIRKQVRDKSFYLFACSEAAGVETFGNNVSAKGNFKIIRNALDLDKFRFNADYRNEIRIEGHSSLDDVVYGNIGSLCKRKNQSFLLELFALILKEEPNAKLWLIGDGEYKQKLKEKARKLKIERNVIFWGQRTDIYKLLCGMDCFVFTTISEGLGIVAVEAQAAGIPTVVSDGVPNEVVLTNSCKMISLERSPSEWAKTIIDFRTTVKNRADNYKTLTNAGYDIKESARTMEVFYLSNVLSH